MVIRWEEDGVLLIGQLAHAFVAGQLARQWGNDRFGTFQPREAVCLAADQHDVGWTEWEQAPEWNPDTGLPYEFLAMPRNVHLRIWRRAGRMLLSMNRYAALLTSLHGTGLYGTYDASSESPEDVDLVREYLRQEIAFQDTLVQILEKDPVYAPYVAPPVLQRNRRLLAVWDRMSLHLCMGFQEPVAVPNVPAAAGTETVRLLPGTPVRIQPNPFRTASATVVLEGRWVPGPFPSAEAFRQGLMEAPWRSIRLEILAAD